VPGKFDYAQASIETYKGKAKFYDIGKLNEIGAEIESLPYSVRIMLENTLRYSGTAPGAAEAVYSLSRWPKSVGDELPFMPCRVLLQDYTGVPLIVDLAAMRTAAARKGLNPRAVNSKIPVDLVVDHSVQVDAWGVPNAIFLNLQKEYERNSERYALLKWAQSTFNQMRIFPPGTGICHQVNLEYLASVVTLHDIDGTLTAFPDTVLGTDSHTTMVNGLGVVGWGVGGIEAEAVMLGEPYYMPVPKVIGVRFTGSLQEGVTPTDLVLTVTEALRKENPVGAFVEYFGEAYDELSVPDRATIGNMSPEYGATIGFSPVDENTIEYLLGTGRAQGHAQFVRKYCEIQQLLMKKNSSEPKYSKITEIDLSTIEPSIAGPRNPDERVPLKTAPTLIRNLIQQYRSAGKSTTGPSSIASQVADNGYQLDILQHAGKGDGTPDQYRIQDGSVIIAAITSCTNTSNPTVMVGAGLLAKRAVEFGLKPKKFVKLSLAPGSTVVTDYLTKGGLLPYLEKLGFSIVGYGCTTCIGNSGPLASEIEKKIKERDLYAVAVLSGNRNFDGRIHPLAKASFLMSPMLVVAYALAGAINFDFAKQPLGIGPNGPVFLKDLWPSLKDIRDSVQQSLSPDMYKNRYANPTEGDAQWRNLKVPRGDTYKWDVRSTYIREPPWFMMPDDQTRMGDIHGARVLGLFEDRVTTDHISPAGTIPPDSPAGLYLQQNGVQKIQFSSYGSRRGNHEVMVRGGFANIRLRNLLGQGKEGGWTTHYPSGDLMTIYDAARRYETEKVPLIILAGKQYGAGSSRDWAAKAVRLLGVRAVIAESFERIHRSNLVAMGVLPLEFDAGQSWKTLGLKGDEVYDIGGVVEIRQPGSRIKVTARRDQNATEFEVTSRLDNVVELEYYKEGGVLPFVLRRLPVS